MTTSETNQTKSAEPEAPSEIRQASTYEIAPEVLSLSVRRSGRLSTRLLALLSILVAGAAVAYFVTSALEIATPKPPMESASETAWEATSALSDGLRSLRPGGSRGDVRPLASTAAESVKNATERVEGLALPTAETPVRARVLAALRADAEWIDAVGSTLANPRSPRRADLSRLAKTAAEAVSLIAADIDGPKGSVGGTGRLLSATKAG